MSIVGVPDQVYGQKVAAVIVVDTSDFDLQQLRYFPERERTMGCLAH